jgi:hypothetical protein
LARIMLGSGINNDATISTVPNCFSGATLPGGGANSFSAEHRQGRATGPNAELLSSCRMDNQMMTVLLALQIVASAPPLSTAEAAAVLRDGPGLSNRTTPPPPIAEGGPVIVVFGGSPTAGPFGRFGSSHSPRPARSAAGYHPVRLFVRHRFRPKFEARHWAAIPARHRNFGRVHLLR